MLALSIATSVAPTCTGARPVAPLGAANSVDESVDGAEEAPVKSPLDDVGTAATASDELDTPDDVGAPVAPAAPDAPLDDSFECLLVDLSWSEEWYFPEDSCLLLDLLPAGFALFFIDDPSVGFGFDEVAIELGS